MPSSVRDRSNTHSTERPCGFCRRHGGTASPHRHHRCRLTAASMGSAERCSVGLDRYTVGRHRSPRRSSPMRSLSLAALAASMAVVTALGLQPLPAAAEPAAPASVVVRDDLLDKAHRHPGTHRGVGDAAGRLPVLRPVLHPAGRPPAPRAGATFEQRLTLLHRSADAPVVLYTGGYGLPVNPTRLAYRADAAGRRQPGLRRAPVLPLRRGRTPADWDDLTIWQEATRRAPDRPGAQDGLLGQVDPDGREQGRHDVGLPPALLPRRRGRRGGLRRPERPAQPPGPPLRQRSSPSVGSASCRTALEACSVRRSSGARGWWRCWRRTPRATATPSRGRSAAPTGRSR